jgi:hypothetical protein
MKQQVLQTYQGLGGYPSNRRKIELRSCTSLNIRLGATNPAHSLTTYIQTPSKRRSTICWVTNSRLCSSR